MPDPNLASKLKQAMSTPAYFAFIARGSAGKLIVDRKKIAAKDVADAKKEIGGGTVFQGLCRGENDALVFETAKEAPGSLAALIKTTIKTDAGLTLKVLTQVSASQETEEGQEPEAEEKIEPVPSAPPTPGPTPGAKTIKRLKDLTPKIKEALTGPNGPRVKALFAGLNDLLQKKDFAEIDKILDQLTVLVRAKN